MNRSLSCGIAAAGRDDLALVEEGVGNRDGLGQKPAGIVAQVEDEAVDLVHAAGVLDGLLQAGCKVVIGLVVEGGDAQDDRIAFDPRLGGGQLDRVADDRHVEGLIRALAGDGDDDLGPDRPAHLVDRLIERQAKHAFAVDMGDEIAGLDAGLVGRGAVDGRDDLDEAVLLRDLDTETAEFAAGLDPHVGEVHPGPGSSNAGRARSASR